MKDNEIIELYWERNEAAITATAEKYGSYCHTISYIAEAYGISENKTTSLLFRMRNELKTHHNFSESQ